MSPPEGLGLHPKSAVHASTAPPNDSEGQLKVAHLDKSRLVSLTPEVVPPPCYERRRQSRLWPDGTSKLAPLGGEDGRHGPLDSGITQKHDDAMPRGGDYCQSDTRLPMPSLLLIGMGRGTANCRHLAIAY